jgi:hypothetical protein
MTNTVNVKKDFVIGDSFFANLQGVGVTKYTITDITICDNDCIIDLDGGVIGGVITWIKLSDLIKKNPTTSTN